MRSDEWTGTLEDQFLLPEEQVIEEEGKGEANQDKEYKILEKSYPTMKISLLCYKLLIPDILFFLHYFQLSLILIAISMAMYYQFKYVPESKFFYFPPFVWLSEGARRVSPL